MIARRHHPRVLASLLAFTVGPLALATPAYAASARDHLDARRYAEALAAYERDAASDPSAHLGIAKSQIGLKRWREAAAALRAYRDKDPKADKAWADQLIAVLERDDDAVELEPLALVNSEKSDYAPIVSQDGKTLWFCGVDRPGGMGGEDVWSSQRGPDGVWQAPKPAAAPLNTRSHEAIEGITSDGNLAVFFGNYPGTFGNGDLFYAVRDGETWSTPYNMGGTINGKTWEAQANLGPDGRTLLWVSDRPGGQGGHDLWASTLSEAGWSPPVNLGPQVNSKGRESSPFISADGRTLYFSSDTHPGFGGRDLFMARRIGDGWTRWTTPVNLGKYVNTDADDAYLTIPASGNRGFLTRTDAPGGKGSDDLFTFVLPYDMRPEPVHQIEGFVHDDQGGPVGAILHFVDVDLNKEVASATSNRGTGMYKVSLPMKRRYMAVIDTKGYLYQSEGLDLRNPTRAQASWRQTLARETPRLKALRARVDGVSARLADLTEAESADVAGRFGELSRASADLRAASQALELAAHRSKMAWLATAGDAPTLRRDYALQPIRKGAKLELKNVFFDTGAATLRPESRSELDRLADVLERAGLSIELGGHTDDVGEDDANLRLSQARVEAVKKHLVGKGIAAGRVAAVGYGERRPVAANTSEAGRQRNRRVELVITQVAARGGQDEVKDEVRYDLASLVRHAAIVGGLPADAPGRDDVRPRPVTTPARAPARVPALALADYVLGENNMYFSTKGPGGGMWGLASISLDEDLNETQWAFHGSGLVPSRFVGSWAAVRAWQLNGLTGQPLTALYGFGVDAGLAGGTGASMNAPMVALDVPLGLRYVYPMGELKLGPELVYHHGLWSAGTPLGTSFTRLGAGVRWKGLSGLAYLDSGAWNSGVGLRAGLTY